MHRTRHLLILVLAVSVTAAATPPQAAVAPQEVAAPADLRQDARVQQAIAAYEVWLEAWRAYQGIPGLSAGIVADQELVWSVGLGYADVAGARVPDEDSIYSICSISKLFTSIAVMQQRDAGALRLDDPVAAYLPWMEIGDAYPGSGPVTVRGILTHSSGLPRESAHPYWTGPEFAFPTRDEVIAEVDSQRTLYPADSVFQYSNLGMTLAGEIVAATSGMSYDEYQRARVLGPLGMDSTFTDIPVGNDRLAVGYGRRDRDGARQALEPFQARGIAPAAGYASSVSDLARFTAWQFRALQSADAGVLATNTLREMQRVQWVDPDWSTHWGLGFSISRNGERTFVGHGGSCPGFRSNLQLQPKERVGAIVLTNAMDAAPGQATLRAHDLVGAAIIAARKSPGEGKRPPQEFADYVGRYESFWGEQAIVAWDDSIASLPLPSDNPREALSKLRHIEGDVFRRVRDDGDLGEEVIFERDASGEVVRLRVHGNASERVR